jgi:hypothetical protein
MGFQTKVNRQQAPAVAGDFASANPTASMLTGEGRLVAGAHGVTVGVFAWADANGVVTNAKVKDASIGFVHREGQSTITTWLAESGNVIQAGQAMTLLVAGDFWVLSTDGAKAGDAVQIDATTGAVATAGQPTNFTYATTAAAGELVKITSWGK